MDAIINKGFPRRPDFFFRLSHAKTLLRYNESSTASHLLRELRQVYKRFAVHGDLGSDLGVVVVSPASCCLDGGGLSLTATIEK